MLRSTLSERRHPAALALHGLGERGGLATLVALREFKTMIGEGWPVGSTSGELMNASLVWIDAGYMTPVVYTFCRESGTRFRPALGRGAAQQHRQWYNRSTRTGALVKHIGEGFQINFLRRSDCSWWRWTPTTGRPGCISD